VVFPLSIADVWKVFEWANRRKAESKTAVSEWLDSVYTDLEDLSRVWFRICENLDNANEKHEIEQAVKIIHRGELRSLQSLYASRLEEFYGATSLVLGSRQNSDFHGDFVLKLATVLQQRYRARQILEKELPLSTVAPENISETLLQMRKMAEAIQRDAVSLQVLIKTFKAQA
jgi:hypothetical protein